MRRKATLRKTYLCAVKFWRAGHRDVRTLASGVRNVVRKQGYKSQDIYKEERRLQREGLIDMAGGFYKAVRLTPKGEKRATCKSVKLAPWTNDPYPGSMLEGMPRLTPTQSKKRITALRRQGCKVTQENVPGVGVVVLKECPRKRR